MLLPLDALLLRCFIAVPHLVDRGRLEPPSLLRWWRGSTGEYVVTLGKSSGAERGSDESLPTLKTTVNAFTRLWLGVRPATALSYTDDLETPAELLEALNEVLRLPAPHPDWDF